MSKNRNPERSARIPFDFLKVTVLESTDLRILLALLAVAPHDEDYPELRRLPKWETLAERFGVSVRTISRSYASLRGKKVVGRAYTPPKVLTDCGLDTDGRRIWMFDFEPPRRVTDSDPTVPSLWVSETYIDSKTLPMSPPISEENITGGKRKRAASTNSAWATLIYLFNFRNDEGECYPSALTIGLARGVSESQIRLDLALLEKEGFIARRRRFDSSTKLYVAALPTRNNPDPSPVAPEQPKKRAPRKTVATVTAKTRQRRCTCDPSGENVTRCYAHPPTPAKRAPVATTVDAPKPVCSCDPFAATGEAVCAKYPVAVKRAEIVFSTSHFNETDEDIMANETEFEAIVASSWETSDDEPTMTEAELVQARFDADLWLARLGGDTE